MGGDMRNPPQGSRQRDREGRKPIQSVLKNRWLSLDIGTQSCWDSPTPPPQERLHRTHLRAVPPLARLLGTKPLAPVDYCLRAAPRETSASISLA